MVATAVSGSKGVTFLDKRAAHVKSCCQSLSSSKALQSFGESEDGTGIVIKTTDSTSIFHLPMQIQCAFACTDTRGSAHHLKTNLAEVQATCQAVTGRQFSSTKFKFMNLLPTVARPSDVALLKALKEVDDGMLDGRYDARQPKAQDAIIYPWLRIGLVVMSAIEGPNFDTGFISMLRTFTNGVLRWSAAGAPLSSVARAVAKFMMEAEWEANQRTALAGRSVAAMAYGGFRASADLLGDIAQLDCYTRSQEVDERLKFRRQCETFGLTVPSAMDTGRKKETPEDKATRQASDVAVAVALRSSYQLRHQNGVDGGGNGGGSGGGTGGGRNHGSRTGGAMDPRTLEGNEDSGSGSDDDASSSNYDEGASVDSDSGSYNSSGGDDDASSSECNEGASGDSEGE
jgi:hypothetical protein